MPALQHILVLVDSDEPTFNVPHTAAAMCRQHGATLHLLLVVDPDHHTRPAETRSDGGFTDPVPTGTELLQTLAERLTRQYSIACSVRCGVGRVSDQLVAEADRAGADLIITGVYGSPDSRSLYLNTEAYRVIKTAGCPVLTVPVRQVWDTFGRVLFPVRPVSGAVEKYEYARTIIRQNNAELTLLALHAPGEVISIDLLHEAVDALDRQLRSDGISSHTLFYPTDEIPETILQKADELHADLLIITATLYTSPADFLAGSFTQQMVYNARTPVLFIRPQVAQRVVWPFA